MAGETWQFYRKQPTDTIQNPISGEFFSTEAVGEVTEALIREGVQNTLDARQAEPDGSRRLAHVRIFLSESEGALAPADARKWFATLWPHIMAPGNGLRNQPSAEDPCRFLVFEDFGTIGLTGNPEEDCVIEGVTNHFLNFFRAEGYSDKGQADRGSWGVGKTVFPRASRISSYLGLTRRIDDDRSLLLGRSILKYHRVNGESFKSDGYFGLTRKTDGFMLPSADTETIDRFCTDFRISRRTESGLSLVIPWYEDSEEGISRDTLLSAVLNGFFYPILMGHLRVTIAGPAGEIYLRQESIIDTIRAKARDFLPIAELAEWAQTRRQDEFVSLLPPPATESQKWSPDMVPPDVIHHIRHGLAQYSRVAIKVPLFVQPRSRGPQQTFFNLFLERSDKDSERPMFIRDELIILSVNAPRTSQIRSLVIVEDTPLATLLRDAETPAHTQWNQSTGNFKNKYKFGAGVISFVRHSVSEILRIVNQSEQQPDHTITRDYFNIPAPPDDDDAVPARRRRPKPEPGDGPNPPPEPPPRPLPKRFRIEKLRGGFRIKQDQLGAPLPPFIDVRVAYDIRRGSPLKKYHPSDFDMGSPPVACNTVGGISVVRASGNRMTVAVSTDGFSLDVTGFDPARDLYVRAEVKEAFDGSQED